MAITEGIVARVNTDLQRARTAAARAEEMLTAARGEIADLEAFLRTLERYVTPTADGRTSTAGREHGQNTGRSVPVTGSRARDLVDTSITAIRAAGRPLLIGELLDAVNAAGLTLGGSDHKSNLAGYLSRDPRVESRGRSTGWIVLEDEWAAPEPASEETTHSTKEGGTDDRSTLASSEFDDLLGSANSQAP